MQRQRDMNKEETNNNNDKLFTGGSGKCLKCREILNKFLSANPVIRSLEYVDDPDDFEKSGRRGDIIFSVFMQDLGLTREEYYEYSTELFSNFVTDTFGEFIVRENIGEFVNLISTINAKDYMDILLKTEHKRFGMRVKGNVIIFRFHISLIQHILTEDTRHTYL
jgi:hypothetical protein